MIARNWNDLWVMRRFSSSDRGRTDEFKLDQRASPARLGRHRTAVNCNPDCNPANRLSCAFWLCAAWTEEGDRSRRYDRRQQEHTY